MLRISLALLASALSLQTVRADDWPQWMGPTRSGEWKETGILHSFPKEGPKKLWSTPIHGGYAGPAVVGDRVYITDYIRKGGEGKNDPGLAAKSEGTERVLCLDAKTGKEIWKRETAVQYAISYPAGPRCTPTVIDGKVYALGAMGNLECLNAENGSVLWSKDFKSDYKAKTPIWGFAGHPLVYKNTVICLVGGDSLLVAFDKDSGKEVWKSLTTPGEGNAGYSPPTIIEAAGVKQLVVWHPKGISSVNPEDGKRYWTAPLEPAYGMSIMAPRQYGDYLFAGGIGYKCVVLKLAKDKPGVEEVWQGKKQTGVYPVNMTPLIVDNVIYAVDQPGSLRAVKLETGERLWSTQQPITGKDDPDERPINSGTAFIVKNGDQYFLFGETGHLIIAKLSPKGYEEVSRAKLVDATNECFGRQVVWSHPAFANKCVYVRNDKEIACYSLAAD
jgi:outer membrane protein assembly factor BamB